MQITAQMVSQLREQTGAGMMECKHALVEAGGDIEKAKDLLRERGVKTAEKRAGRATAEGVVAIGQTDSALAMIELNSETDFVARNPDFRELASLIAQTAASAPCNGVEALLNTPTEDGETVQQKIAAAIARIRENIALRRVVRYERRPDRVLAYYVHAIDHKTGVIIDLKGDPSSEKQAEVGRHIAMHTAFTKPKYLRREEVPASEVEHEREVLTAMTRNEGKPEAAIPKIVEGRLGKFFENICLVEQPYVRDPNKRIGALAAEAGAEVRGFSLYLVGQD